ncbi:MAG: hypothetical protein K2V38_29320, partial [Gemmataceae bacterium]|nr:hypothetical protein [Gemmataceae bacterium]
GRSHFALHAGSAGGGGLGAFVEYRLSLVAPLAGYLGCLAVGVGLLAGSALGVSRRRLAVVAGVWCAGFALVAALPRRWTLGADFSGVTTFWQASGFVWLTMVFGCAGLLLVRWRRRFGVRTSRASLFLAGWLAIEIVGALGLTPFPAARRVIGITLVAGLIAARAVSLVERADPDRKPPRWVFGVGVAAGCVVGAIDLLDAFPEKACAEGAAEVVRSRREDTTIWYVGHWGFQYYCDRAGMRPLIADQTTARAGSYLVIPIYPEGDPFPRPYAGFEVSLPPDDVAEALKDVVWDDFLSAKTVPNYYGGVDPVCGRDAPRLRVRVYRLKTDWVMPSQRP